MHKTLRLALVALLMLALPLSAFAGMGVAKRCIMKANGVVVAMDHDCCDPEKAFKSSIMQESCKSGQECNTPSSVPPMPAIETEIAPSVLSLKIVWHSPPVAFHQLDSLWRPPR